MLLKHIKTIFPPQDGAAKVTAMCWSPNNKKMAVVSTDRVISFFDDSGEMRDKFGEKPGEPKTGKKGFLVKGLAFSPDSTKIALGQSDNIVFVYKIGEEWGDRKVICNKFIQASAVTCLIWPPESKFIIFGLADGKVRIADLKTNKSQTAYGTGIYCVSLCANTTGKGILSGHADGAIVRYMFDENGTGFSQGQVVKHSCPPYSLCWGSSIMAAGCDKRIVAYSKEGKILQTFDYSKDLDEKEFTVAVTSPSGQSIVIGSFDRLRVFNWSPRKTSWEESKPKEMKNLYTISSLSWKRDGSKLLVGTLCGGVELFDCCLKRSVYKDKFEMTYVGLSQVIVKNLENGKRVVLKSHYGYEIDEVKIMGKDRFLVAHTTETLLVGDLNENKLSEVPWHNSGGNEKFFFENENVCMVFNAGELSLVEYGQNEVLATVRTEFINPHLISVRLNERKLKDQDDNKKLAYLIDLKTICVMNLKSGMALANVTHDTKIDWLEMNETGRKLLFRDKKLRLYLADIQTEAKTIISNYCSYVQWVPMSDVVVSQNRCDLCVWYNIDSPDRVTMFPIKGDIIDLEKADGKTNVLVHEGVQTVSYTLDEGLIEFGTAIEDCDYDRAVAFLENLELSPETEAMWKTLTKVAMEKKQLFIAERCYAALGDISRARFLHNINDLIDEISSTTAGDPMYHPSVSAKLAMFEKQFKLAESIYLEQGLVDEAMEMYQELHKWDEALAIAEAKRHPELEALQTTYFQWLMKSGQEEKAGEVKENNGEYGEAINLYLKANLPARAARLALRIPSLSSDNQLLERIALSLLKGSFYEKAGELFEKTNSYQRALEAYRKGKAYRRAVELARSSFPKEVIRLEEEWGDYLISQKQLDAAINHFIEAGCSVKAIEAAIQSRQWNKAVQIVELQDEEIADKYYPILAKHYAQIQQFQLAERFYVQAGLTREAVEMYTRANKYDEAHKLAIRCMNPEEVSNLYISQAEHLESQGKYKEAEKLYITVDEADMAINMYRKAKMYDQMINLVKIHHEDLITDTHIHLAKELESERQYTLAEHHYLEAEDWKAAVNMYRGQELWEDAFRVAKQYGGVNSSKQVAFLWAKTLSGDSAIKLLQKFNMLDSCIEYATDTAQFDFAFELARTSSKEKLSEIHAKYAMFLEDEGRFKEAEEQFIKAGKPKEAVLMYVHQVDWTNATRVAEQHDPNSLVDVLIAQAKISFDKKNYEEGESFLLRAQRPEIAIKFYRENNMWQDVLRIAKEYLPHKLNSLQDEYEKVASMSRNDKGAESFISQGRDWETRAEYNRAIDLYLKVTPEMTNKKELLEKVYSKAVELAVKFSKDRAIIVTQEVCKRLLTLELYETASDLYSVVKMHKEAINACISGELWQQARSIASDIAPKYEEYVEEKYVEYLKSKQMAEKLIGVDVIAALDMYVEQGAWAKCIEQAKKQSFEVLTKYVTLYAAHLIKEGNLEGALSLFVEHGAPPNHQNFNVYKRLVEDLFAKPGLSGADSYQVWADLRSMLYGLCEGFTKKPTNPAIMKIFNTMLLVAHYYAVRAAVTPNKALEIIRTKISVSLLRYSDMIPCDKAFYEAGIDCKAVGWDNMAFVFLNRYLDISEGIEEGNLDSVDNTDFTDTDIPMEVSVPEAQFVAEDQREEVKEWVLAISMDQKVEQNLPMDNRNTFEASLITPKTGETALPCVISGYPVLTNGIEFKKPNKMANKDDWNKFVMATKVSRSPECQQVLHFLSQWCGFSQNANFSFT
ncbi:intraflagellar transport protein 172 homolog isoform X3 [Hydra vulgaris]|uniref:Intraflagellar transport protein 172 homolog isoform X3 n=1 Tax=Hydra vulgaris TaxID=6087 RepID=A0ABM4D6X8_HYDVU